jgi:DNA polymerase-3 subunit gamma/tau
MSYLVLARKYRPQSFAEIVGQEHVTRTLANAFAKGRVHHAFLFCGARGVGKTTAARVLAKALCCVHGPTATPCGVCDPCATITSGTAVDYYEIDGASNNGVDDIRELRDGVRYQPAQLRRKIYVIDEVHMLSVAAFNALLKTLEEPPPHVTFIFATTEVHKIPITILSRCQRYDFKLVPSGVLRAHLKGILEAEHIPVEPGALQVISREAGGSVRDALSLTDQVIAYTGGEAISEARAAEVLGVADRGLLRGLLGAVVAHDARAALLAVDAALARGVDISHLARTFLATLRDAAVVKSVPDCEGLVDAAADEIADVRALVGPVPRTHLVALFDRFAKACEELRESPSPRLLVEVALIDMASSEPLAPLAELVDRLGELEARTRGRAPAPPRPAPKPVPTPSPSPPPSAPPAPPAAPRRAGAPADPFAEWERVVAALQTRGAVLYGYYSRARLLSWTDAGIELGSSSPLAVDADHVKELTRAVGEILGAAVVVKVKPLPAEKPEGKHEGKSVAEVEAARESAERAEREKEARAHPLTEKVIQTFGASIKEIKLDG